MTEEVHPNAIAKTKYPSQTNNFFINLPPCTNATLKRGRVECQRACVASGTSRMLVTCGSGTENSFLWKRLQEIGIIQRAVLEDCRTIFFSHRRMGDTLLLAGLRVNKGQAHGIVRTDRMFHVGQDNHQIFGKSFLRPTFSKRRLSVLTATKIKNVGN